MINSTELAQKFDQEWSWLSKLAAAHPKTTIIAGLLIGGIIGWLV